MRTATLNLRGDTEISIQFNEGGTAFGDRVTTYPCEDGKKHLAVYRDRKTVYLDTVDHVVVGKDVSEKELYYGTEYSIKPKFSGKFTVCYTQHMNADGDYESLMVEYREYEEMVDDIVMHCAWGAVKKDSEIVITSSGEDKVVIVFDGEKFVK